MMLHEVLFALNGFAGGLIEDRGNEFKVIEGVNFHPSILEQLNRLSRYGFIFKQIRKFIDKYLTFGTERYLFSLCEGLNSVLNDYRSKLIEMEQAVLADHHLTLAYFIMQLEPYFPLLKQLHLLTNQVDKAPRRGCHLLDIVYRNCNSGFPIIHAAFKKLLQHLHRVMFKQLRSWVLHGSLSDHHKEFFIQPSKQDKGFNLNHLLLPSYISVSTANKILFTGNAITLLKNQHNVGSENRGVGGISLLKNHEEFLIQLKSLEEAEEFSRNKFDIVIDNIRQCVAEQLWQIIVKDGNLINQLQMMKDLYLLGRGELFLTFIQLSDALLSQTITTMAHLQADVNAAFQMAGQKVYLDDDLLDKCTFVFPPEEECKGKQGWSVLSLRVSISPQLHMLFTPKIVKSYNNIFSFLLQLKRTQWLIHNTWAQLTALSRTTNVSVGVWHLQSKISFLIDTLQYYIQVDVLDSEMSQLIDKIKTIRDYQLLLQVHNATVATIMANSFMLNKPVLAVLTSIMKLTAQFCDMISASTGELVEDQFQQIDEDLWQQFTVLFHVLNSMTASKANTHFTKLLIRMDFNKYFSKQNPLLLQSQ